MRARRLGCLVVAALGVVTFCGLLAYHLLPDPQAPFAWPLQTQVPPFALVDQEGRPRTLDDLLGRVWVAGFIFTRCQMSCPRLTEAMAQLQKTFGGRVLVVAFSVDPEHDQPEVLREYARGWGAANDWWFLTGDKKTIYESVAMAFLAPPRENPEAEPGMRIAHSPRLFLVDDTGHIRASYPCVVEVLDDGGNPTGHFEIARHALKMLEVQALDLAQHRLPLAQLPRFNATCNAVSTVLLIVGLLCIRARLVDWHAAMMLTAAASSLFFLGGYLMYHLQVGSVPFAGPKEIRLLYLAILFSHSALAAILVPLVPLTLLAAVRGNWERHRRLARWAWPTWFYVSLTGIVVYVFLYGVTWAPV
ncbi:MAG: DUF420 domain-containing protein [Gemmataceae bacterium]